MKLDTAIIRYLTVKYKKLDVKMSFLKKIINNSYYEKKK